jgi:hypothetical protein
MNQRFLPLGLLTCAVLGGCLSGNSATSPPWFQRSLVGLEVGPTGAQFGGDAADVGYAAKFDGREIARATKACGGEYLVIWARDGDWAYYDSKLQPKPPGLGSRDTLREAVEEGHKLGLPVIAYCQLQYPAQTLRQHPDWRAVDKDGKPIDGRVCYRTEYREFMKQMLSEQLAYGIDGFHLDMVDQGFSPPYGCWCAVCQKEFQAEHGHPLPKGVTWDEDWDRMLAFRYASSDRFEKEMTEHIRSVKPRATVDFNYHGNPPFSWEVGQLPVRHAQNGDFVTGETGVWGFSALTVGLNAEFYRAATPGKPVQVAMQRGVRMYHDQTTRPLNDMRWEMFNLLAHGAFVTMIDKTAFDGWLDPVAYERFGAMFREVHAKRAHFGQSPVQDVGIYYSSRTRDWIGREKPADWFMSFQGAHKAMVYEHIPWGVIHEESLSLETLKKFPVVLLPNVGILSEGEVALLRRYVEEGGNLIATGLSGVYDHMGRLQAKSSLETLTGARLVRKLDSTDNWVRFHDIKLRVEEHAKTRKTGHWSPAELEKVLGGHDAIQAVLDSVLSPARHQNWPFLVRGPAVVYEPTTATPVGELLKPYRTALHEQKRYNEDWPLSADSPVGPAILLNTVGKGKVLTIAGSPDWATASDHHIVEVRKLLANAVHLLNPSPRIRITAPATVETIVTDDPTTRTLRIHLLGYNAPPQTTPAKERPYILPGLIEDAPIYRVNLTFEQPVKRCTAFNKSTVLKRRGAQVTAVVEDIHEVVTVQY